MMILYYRTFKKNEVGLHVLTLERSPGNSIVMLELKTGKYTHTHTYTPHIYRPTNTQSLVYIYISIKFLDGLLTKMEA